MKPGDKSPVFDERISSEKMFIVETANSRIERAKLLPNPKPLIGNLWKEGELLILFAYTGSGKTTLAQQIAKALSEGDGLFENQLPNEAGEKKVLYFDAELSDKQFENRYSIEYKDHTSFNGNLYYMQVNRQYILNEKQSYSKSIIPEIENEILEKDFNVIIIDNLHCLKEGLEKSKEAKPLMDKITALKHKYNVSIMVVGHTPKQHKYKMMELSDLQGSSALSIQLDSCVAIGNSKKGDDIKYLVEVKRRDGKYIFNNNNVITCRIEKEPFLKMNFQQFEKEANHLLELDDVAEETITATILALKDEGQTVREITNQVPYGQTKVHSIIKNNCSSENKENIELKENKALIK